MVAALGSALGCRLFLDGVVLHVDSAVQGRAIVLDPSPDEASYRLAGALCDCLLRAGARVVVARGADERPTEAERRRRVRRARSDMVLQLTAGPACVRYPLWPPAANRRAARTVAAALGGGGARPTLARPAGWRCVLLQVVACDAAAVCRGVIAFFRLPLEIERLPLPPAVDLDAPAEPAVVASAAPAGDEAPAAPASIWAQTPVDGSTHVFRPDGRAAVPPAWRPQSGLRDQPQPQALVPFR